MTAVLDIVNRALQSFGSRTTVAALNENSNEAIQANLVLNQVRDELLRTAPWNCATNFNNLTLITAVPGTPENPTSGTVTWQKGIPAPPWSYEYQYPVDCLRPLFVIPQYTTGFSGGTPITTAVTGGAPSFWNGPPVRFKVSIDQFFSINSAVIIGASGGTGYAVGDILTLNATPPGTAPIGAPAQVQVTSVVGGGNAIGTVAILNVVQGETTPLGGSYFAQRGATLTQSSTTGSGSGAVISVTWQAQDQRVILTNQEFGTMCYVRQVTDPNVMDPQFQQAWVAALGGRLVMALTGDKTLANMQIQVANNFIMGARLSDGNEGLTINDVTPDWIRIRGFDAIGPMDSSSNGQIDWGPLLTLY